MILRRVEFAVQLIFIITIISNVTKAEETNFISVVGTVRDGTVNVFKVFNASIVLTNSTAKVFKSVVKVTNVLVKVSKVIGTFNIAVSLISSSIEVYKLFTTNNHENSMNTKMKERHAEVMHAIEDITNQITDLDRQLQQGIARTIEDTSITYETILDYKLLMQNIDKQFNTINALYMVSERKRGQFKKFKLSKESMEDFERDVFGTVESTLQRLYGNYIQQHTNGKNYFQLFNAYCEDKYTRHCNQPSHNQELYMTYLSLLAIEIKGFSILSHGNAIRAILHKRSYTDDIIASIQASIDRLNGYTENFVKFMPSSSREIRTCSSKYVLRDETFVELERYIRFDYVPTGGSHPELEDEYNATGPVSYRMIDDGEQRYYEWIEESGKGTYGKKNGPTTGSISASDLETLTAATAIYGHNIHTHAQLSAVRNNMVITGVKFVRVNKMLSIQIKQGKLTADGIIADSMNYEELQTGFFGQNDVFTKSIREMYIDDVILDRGYVVTGLQLALTNSKTGYKLRVRGTRYDREAGLLIIEDEKWYDPENMNTQSLDYKRPRQAILVKNMANPMDATIFQADVNTNKFVRFERTSLESNAGQTTIPLFDAQPVTMSVVAPLNGIGIYYKSAAGYGGYLGLRLFTEPVEEYISATDDSMPSIVTI